MLFEYTYRYFPAVELLIKHFEKSDLQMNLTFIHVKLPDHDSLLVQKVFIYYLRETW